MANGLSILDVRLDAIEKAQQRYRTAFFLTTIASTVLAIMAFNRTLSFEQGAPIYRGNTEREKIIFQNELSRRLARDSYTIPLLGVSISVWDLGLIGPAALFIFAFYFSAASRSVRSQ